MCIVVRFHPLFLVLLLAPLFALAENKTEIPAQDVSQISVLKRHKGDWRLQFGGSVLDGTGLQAIYFPKDSLSVSFGAGTTIFTGNLSAGFQYYISQQKTWSPYVWSRYAYMVSTGLF